MLASLFLVCLAMAGAGVARADFTLAILHVNDTHARLEPVNAFNASCAAADDAAGRCVGGFARLKTKLDERRRALSAAGVPVLTLHAGDPFSGSVYDRALSVQQHAALLGALGLDAMAIGLYELDRGSQALEEFIEAAPFAVISANVLAGASSPLAGGPAPAIVKDFGGERVAVIAVLTPMADRLVNTGADILVADEIAALRDQTARISADGVNRIIVLSHAGLARDRKIAAVVPGIDAIVGGFDHAPFANSQSNAASAYPVWADGVDGARVPIVQAHAYATRLGELSLTFDDAGGLEVADGQLHVLDASLTPDAGMRVRIAGFAEAVETRKRTEIAVAALPIAGDRETCRYSDCPMGSLVADAVLDAAKRHGAQVALINAGAIRASFDAGAITAGDVLAVLPRQHELAVFTLSGGDVVAALENGVGGTEAAEGRFPQVAGLRFGYNPSAPTGKRIHNAEIADGGTWRALRADEPVRVAATAWLRAGGDGYTVFRDRAAPIVEHGPLLEDVLAGWLTRQANVGPPSTGRIVALGRLQFPPLPAASAGMTLAPPQLVREAEPVVAAPADRQTSGESAPPRDGQEGESAPAFVDRDGRRYYVIQAGDNPWTIARRIYGAGRKWTILEQANPGVAVDRLQIGDEILAPEE